jgi:hypothetical protein
VNPTVIVSLEAGVGSGTTSTDVGLGGGGVAVRRGAQSTGVDPAEGDDNPSKFSFKEDERGSDDDSLLNELNGNTDWGAIADVLAFGSKSRTPADSFDVES